MKKTITALTAALLLSGTFATAAMAQYPGQYGITGGEVARFDYGYLDEHPEVARQLAQNPALVDNPVFRANHPGLDTYLANHPYVRTELQQHPYRFMGDERGVNRLVGPRPLVNTDRYLDSHPGVATQLNRDPRLIDNRGYVDNHPQLHEFLNTHPVARADWTSHPYRFLGRADRR